MANPYHDENGRFCSRDEMKAAISRLAAEENFTAYFNLRSEYEVIEEQNNISSKIGELNNDEDPNLIMAAIANTSGSSLLKFAQNDPAVFFQKADLSQKFLARAKEARDQNDVVELEDYLITMAQYSPDSEHHAFVIDHDKNASWNSPIGTLASNPYLSHANIVKLFKRVAATNPTEFKDITDLVASNYGRRKGKELRYLGSPEIVPLPGNAPVGLIAHFDAISARKNDKSGQKESLQTQIDSYSKNYKTLSLMVKKEKVKDLFEIDLSDTQDIQNRLNRAKQYLSAQKFIRDFELEESYR